MSEITINSISLNLEGWILRKEAESYKIWINEHGDQLSADYFAIEPDLPKNSDDLEPLRDMYRSGIMQSKGAIVEVEKDYIKSLLAIRSIFKFPQSPTGFTFVASYTIPREKFSFVLKVQCPERGMTGMRESVILDIAIRDGLVNPETREGWFRDPYDPNFKAPILSNLADDEKHDTQFPNHPLTRARITLQKIKDQILFSEEILSANNFFAKLN